MGEIVLLADVRITSVEVCEQRSKLVDAAGTLSIDSRKADPRGAWRLVREPVRARLAEAVSALPEEFMLVLIEGYRPPDLQERYFNAYRGELIAQDPDLTEAEARQLASRGVSPPEVAPHSAGAAVDVSLADQAGLELNLGCRVNASPEASDGRCYTWHPDVTGEALRLRRILAEAMAGAGFVNYPTEWWHWSYGDRYWAYELSQPHALFGPVLLRNQATRDKE